MKSFLNLSMFAFFLVVAAGCGQKSEHVTATQQEREDWTHLDDFHLIMADLYHPYKDSSYLQPVKERAEELARAAEQWAGAALPAKMDNEEIKKMLQELKSGTRTLADDIAAGAADDQIGEKLDELHSLFHHVQESWYEGGHGSKHNH
jgi:hypothetical protein